MLLHLVDVYHGHCWTPTHLRLPISGGALVYVYVYLTLHHCIFSVCSFTLVYISMIHTTNRLFSVVFSNLGGDYLLGHYTFTEG